MYIRLTLFFPLLLVLTLTTAAQVPGAAGYTVPVLHLPTLDNEALLAEELAQRRPGRAPHFAFPHGVDIHPDTHGAWEARPDGARVWRLRLVSEHAYSLNLGFLEYYMPPGGELYLYDGTGQRQGPFTPADNEAHNQLWTPLLPGDKAEIEVRLPNAEAAGLLRLRLTSVNHDFAGFSQLLSGSCNLDIACGKNNGWPIVELYRDVIDAVAMYSTEGTRICTGFLVNNARQDCTTYFLTADHCFTTGTAAAASMVVYWNYENSTCRQPNTPGSGQTGNGSLAVFNTGALVRARSNISDFMLLELDDEIAPAARVFYAGWSRSSVPPTDTLITVHHPNVEEKRISFSFANSYRTNGVEETPASNGSHLVVPFWAVGTTEGGSSGAPLFDRFRRVRGQLHGGLASCNQQKFDSFGFFARSWEGGTTSASRLRDWLDPDDTGIIELDGRGAACSLSLLIDATAKSACIPQAVQYRVTPTLLTGGTMQLRMNQLPRGFQAAFSTEQATSGQEVIVTVQPPADAEPGKYSLMLVGQATDGGSIQVLLTLNLEQKLAVAPALLQPASGAQDQILQPQLSWSVVDGASVYDVELSRMPDFAVMDVQSSLSDAKSIWQSPELQPRTTYYWRVRAGNDCGPGEWSEVRHFTTGLTVCPVAMATDVPLIISGSQAGEVVSRIEIQQSGRLLDLALHLDIEHSWVGDIGATLVAPDGTTIKLFDRPGYSGAGFGCSEPNLRVTFSDAAERTASMLEQTCNPGGYAAEGAYQPLEKFEVLRDKPITGTWTLRIQDAADQDGGQLRSWSLDLCAQLPLPTAVTEADGRVLRLLPNPAREAAFLHLEGPWSGTLEVQLMDAGGRQVSHWQVQGTTGDHRLDTAALPAGMYWLRISNGNERWQEKLVLIR